MVAFARSAAETRANPRAFEIVDAFVVEFWLKPARYKKANGSETPFWSYYPYEQIRDTLLNNLLYWDAPGGEEIAYRGLNIEADQLAVTLTFNFTASFQWCYESKDKGDPFTISFNLCADQSCCPEEIKVDDPCA
jgi:hypothetical protein